MGHAEIYKRVEESYNTNTYNEEYRVSRILSKQEHRLLMRVMCESPTPVELQTQIMDVCCGDGTLYDRFMEEQGCHVTGVDISARQINEAIENVPMADYIYGNFLHVPIKKGWYGGVICMYGLFNFIGYDQIAALKRMFDILHEGGKCLINVRHEISDGVKYVESWCGKEMFWYLPGVDRVKDWCETIGFEVEVEQCEINADYVYMFLTKPESKSKL